MKKNTETIPSVAHIIYSIKSSQLKDLVSSLIYKQIEKGMQSDIIHIVEQDETSTVLKIREINVYTYTKPKGLSIKLVFKLSRFLKTHHYKVVHAHSPQIAIIATLAARLAGAKSIFSYHDTTNRPISALVRGLTNYIVTASEYIHTKLLKDKKISNRKVKLIYDGIDEHIYINSSNQENYNEYRHKLGLQQDSFLIGNIGPLINCEDQATLIKAFRKLRAKGLNAELVFTGNGPLLGELRKLAVRYHLEDRIKFVPDKLTKVEYLQMFDVLVHSANRERYPFILLEAMAAGTPVIATKIGANAEVILERKTGYLVPCGFPERIDSAIMRLNAIKTLPKEMGEESKRHIKKDFTIDKMVEQYQELYVS